MKITISKKGSDESIGIKVDKETASEFFSIIKDQQFDCAVEIGIVDENNKIIEHAVVNPQ